MIGIRRFFFILDIFEFIIHFDFRYKRKLTKQKTPEWLLRRRQEQGLRSIKRQEFAFVNDWILIQA